MSNPFPRAAALPAGAIALAAGTMVGLGTDHQAWTGPPALEGWLDAFLVIGAVLAVTSAAALWAAGPRLGSVMLACSACAVLGLVVGTHDARTWHRCRLALGVTHHQARALVELHGTVVTAPDAARVPDRDLQPLAADRRAVRFTLGAIHGPHGEPWPDRATINARIGVGSTDLAIGDRIRVTGWITPMRPPTNPGGYDMARWARSRFVVGSLFIDSPDLVRRTGHDPRPVDLWKHLLVRRLERLVDGMAPDLAALCVAMTLGPTSAPMDDIAADCQVTGMTHVLALSGFNVGLLLALAARVLVLLPARGPPRAALLVACAAVFMASASAGISADRAALAAMVASGAAGFGGRVRAWHAASIVMVAIVLATPCALLDIGFQLSAVVALALAAWAHRAPWLAESLVRCVVRGPGPLAPPTRTRSTMQALVAAMIVGTIAFLASTPIVLHHFGSITPLVVPGSIVAAPLSAAIVTLCTIGLVASAVSVGLASWITVPAGWCAAAFAILADGLASFTAAAWSVEPIHGLACTGALACLVLAMRRIRAVHRPSTAPWLAPPLLALVWWAWPGRFDLRVTVLDVGNGSAWVVEYGDEAFLVDAGSLDAPDVGARAILPALRSLGIGRLSAMSLSHADLDHLNGMPAILERLPVDRLWTTRAVIEGACDGTPSARVLDAAGAVGAVPIGIECGDAMRIGAGTWSALHPAADTRPFPRNESSLVWFVRVGHATLLLTGDVEEQGARRVHAAIEAHSRPGDLMLVELPHHGSFRPGVATLLERLRPAWIGQSTGPARIMRDRWAFLDATSLRSVTARDGAVRVTIDGASMRVERWDHGWKTVPEAIKALR
ncbi:MAG: ComEC/Rec2 family competence protein [Phycisphaerales bacterium]